MIDVSAISTLRAQVKARAIELMQADRYNPANGFNSVCAGLEAIERQVKAIEAAIAQEDADAAKKAS